MGNCKTHFEDQVLDNMNTRQALLYNKVLQLKLNHLNFEPLKLFYELYSQASSIKPTKDYLDYVMLEFKRFFFLGVICDTREGQKQFQVKSEDLVPSPIVDRMWRLILTNTNVYAKACSGLFSTDFFLRDGSKFFHLENYSKTLCAYENYFGRPKTNIWPRFKNQESLKIAQRGFLFFQTTEFKRFHEQFVKNVSFMTQKRIHQQYTSQVKNLQNDEIYHMHKYQNEWLGIAKKKSSGRLKMRHLSSNFVANVNLTLDDISEKGDEETEDLNDEEKKWRKELLNISMLLFRSVGIQKIEKELKVCPSNVKVSHRDIVDDSIDSIKVTQLQDVSVIKKSTFASSYLFQKALQQEPKSMLKEKWNETKFNLNSKLNLYHIPKLVLNTLRKETNSTKMLVEAQFNEFKRFLVLTAISKVRLIPSQPVKEAWDYFLAQSQAYREFCFQVFGEFKPSCQDAAGNPCRYQATKILYRDVFHQEPNPYFWPETSQQKMRMFPRYKFINIMGSVTELLIDSNKVASQRLQKPRIRTDQAHIKKAIEGLKY